MKTISGAMQTHIQQETTTLCTCWRLERKDGVIQGFTDHVQDLVYEGITYEAATGFTPSSITSTEDLAVDNLEVTGLLDSNAISEDDLFAGRYDEAEVFIFMVNYEDLTMGDIKLKRGTLGEVRSGRVVFEAELRSHAQKLQQTVGEVYSVTCRADLGDARCGLIMKAARWQPNTLYVAGEVIRATYANENLKQFVCATGGYSGSVEPTWNLVDAGNTNGVATAIDNDGEMASAKGVNWDGGAEWTIPGGQAECDGTQTVATLLSQSPPDIAAVPYDTSFVLTQLPDQVDNGDFATDTIWAKGTGWTIAAGVATKAAGTASFLDQTPTASLQQIYYSTSFDLSNWTAGSVRIVIGGTAGTWRTTTDQTYTETLLAGVGAKIEIEADASFAGDIDNVIVAPYIEQARIVVGGTTGTWRTTAGTHVETLTAGPGTEISIEFGANGAGIIDDVQVTEVVDTAWTTQPSLLKLGSVTSVVSNEKFTDNGRAEANGTFDGGLLSFNSGANAGLSMEIKTFISDEFQLALPFPYDVQVTDDYDVYQGCDKTLTTCKNTFSNTVNMRAEPYIPGMDEITKFGGQ